MDDILVSIACIAYNHEKYIEKAIKSILMQKTNFKYEILIHDDASTDRTQEIIRSYEKKYPDIIKPIYQKENQYSKGVWVEFYNYERARGKYLAICEGDDYWIDPLKLKKQITYLEQHKECSLCVHAGNLVSAIDEKIISQNRPNRGNKVFEVSEIIAGGGGLFLTNSMVCRTEFVQTRPDYFEIAPVGDYPLAINLSLLGTVYYIDEFMSEYRVGVEGSWTDRIFSNIEKRKQHVDKTARMLDDLNKYTKYQYKEVIRRTKIRNQFNLLLAEGEFEEIKKEVYKEIYLDLEFKRKLIIYLNQNYPRLSKFLKSARKKLIS